ncbi:MAG TPA: hypothetical protein DDY14_13860 [Chromatiaceae bacterium]|jgi:hypothetical protein|nr:MAG: hypothetical protein N838_06830 [Thiohalocapsa sp. PB-PSB1]QQO52308.1 MAG: hypothetical protein N838_01805 [Thiohalocapsa sp. PB-PSB1]HBG96366.1 hypothetical protein [Chromatiaceae bacterium]
MAQAVPCPAESVQVHNLTLFPACRCREHDYPELAGILEQHRLRLERPGRSAWSEEVAGRIWFYRSINLRWQDDAKRVDPASCGKQIQMAS